MENILPSNPTLFFMFYGVLATAIFLCGWIAANHVYRSFHDLKLSRQQMRGLREIVGRGEIFCLVVVFPVCLLVTGNISWKLLSGLALFFGGMLSGWSYETGQQHARDKKMAALKAMNQLRQQHVSAGK